MFDKDERPGPQPGRYGWYASGPARCGKEDPAPQPEPGRYGWHTPEPVRGPIPHSENTASERRYLYHSTEQQAALTALPTQKQLLPAPTASRPPQEGRKKQGRALSRGLVAALLVVSLVGGAVGGGAVSWYLGGQAGQDLPPVQGVFMPTIAQPGAGEPSALAATDVTYAVDRAAASVVEISLSTRVPSLFWGDRESQSAGSGVILSEDGYIVTNHHVIENAEEIYVHTYDGREFAATLVGSDPQTDLAVIKIDAQGLRPARFANSDEVRVGQTAVAIGNPLGTLGGTVTQGIVSATDRQIAIDGHTMTLMQTSAAVNPGNSGGGLFNASGELIGVVNAKSSGMDIEGLGFAIPSNIAAEIADDLMHHGFITGRPELGIQVAQITNPEAAIYHGVSGAGIFVTGVTRENGLVPGDQILYINGEAIMSIAQVSDAVQTAGVGGQMQMTIVREGETLTIDVTVSERVPEVVHS